VTRRPTAAIFDLDGTLVDTTYLHALAWWRVTHEAGIDVPFATFHRLIGMGSDQLTDEVFGGPRDDLVQARADHYKTLHDEVRPLPGAAELVRAVADRGVRVVIGTSGEPQDVDAALELLGIEDVLHATVNSAEADASKPEPDIFQLALDRAEVDARDAVVIGDTIWDVKAAVRCGVTSIGLLTGGHATEDLKAAGAAAVYDDPADLLAHLDESPLGPVLPD
jgi:HAD superfamily hydrolase (TIGR01509 family)